jgi:hypothetical protein
MDVFKDIAIPCVEKNALISENENYKRNKKKVYSVLYRCQFILWANASS